MTHIDIYLRDKCSQCNLAKSLLDTKGVPYNEINLDYNDALAFKVMRAFNQRSVPQIVINNTAIGGYEALEKLESNGRLDSILTAA